MRRKFMATISAVLVLVMFAGSTLAFAEPKGDVQIEQFFALQGVQAEPLADNEMALVEGKSILSMLIKLNMHIYSKAGWELGRYIALKETGFDAGPWPGLKKAVVSPIAGKLLKKLMGLMKKYGLR